MGSAWLFATWSRGGLSLVIRDMEQGWTQLGYSRHGAVNEHPHCTCLQCWNQPSVSDAHVHVHVRVVGWGWSWGSGCVVSIHVQCTQEILQQPIAPHAQAIRADLQRTLLIITSIPPICALASATNLATSAGSDWSHGAAVIVPDKPLLCFVSRVR